MLGTGGFHYDGDYALVIFIDKIHFDFGNFAVLQAESHCTVDKLFQIIDSHVPDFPPALGRKILSAVWLSKLR